MQNEGSGYDGLINCHFLSGQASSGILSYCWLKASELVISAIFVLICCYEIFKQIKVYDCKLQWRFFSLLFMITSLLTNIAFCIWNTVYELYSIQTYLYSLYYLTIAGYVFRLYMRKNLWDSQPMYNYLFSTVLLIMGLLYTAILIDSIVQERSPKMVNKSCEQIWYLCVNIICLALCFAALIVVFLNHKQESQRLLLISYSDTQQIHNPFKQLWCWIGFNTLAQIADLIQTGLLIGTSFEYKCMIIKDNELGNNFLVFFFAIFTLTAGYAATLYYFAQVRKASGYVDQIDLKNSVDISQDLRGSYGVQMFNTFLQNIA